MRKARTRASRCIVGGVCLHTFRRARYGPAFLCRQIGADRAVHVSGFALPQVQRSLLVKKLYVGNLPFQATEQDVANWFTQAGVSSPTVTLVRDQMSGQLRGFGFVEVADDEEANRAIQSLTGQDFMGRNVVVNEARPRESGGGRGGFGGGRGGQGRGGGGGGRDGGGGRGGRY
jgi:cold-inducible RNA-binding protein